MIQDQNSQRPTASDQSKKAQGRLTPADIPGGRIVLGALILPFVLIAPATYLDLSPLGVHLALAGEHLLAGLMVLLVGWKVNFYSLGWNRLDRSSWVWIVGIAGALISFSHAVHWLFLAAATELLMSADRAERLREQLSQILMGDGPPASVMFVDAFAAIILAPIIEEVIFRGFLLRRWAAKWGIPTGLAVSSLLFAAVHGMTAVHAFIWGLVLGLLYLWTQNLLVPIAAHMAGNAGTMLAEHIDHIHQKPVFQLFVNDPTSFAMIALAFLLVGGAALWIMLRLVRRQAPVDVRAPWSGGQLRLERWPLRAERR